ncbi:MAG TPA: S-ribosylhomocysteine lyase [Clostridiales bacterium]|jgi:S-ribosylhomocysteine lyase|nr:S-ribosylhomocysteine lyase [Clostridiales bacterium]
MEKIESFKIDHLNHPAGIYLSRRDGDICTYDVRICKPYADELLTNAEMHSLEHLLATVLRNGAHGAEVIYVGPMGCQTGFYVLYRGLGQNEAERDILAAFRYVADYDGEMPGNSKAECGNCLNLSVAAARRAATTFLERIGK